MTKLYEGVTKKKEEAMESALIRGASRLVEAQRALSDLRDIKSEAHDAAALQEALNATWMALFQMGMCLEYVLLMQGSERVAKAFRFNDHRGDLICEHGKFKPLCEECPDDV